MKMQIADYEVRPGVVPSGEKAVVRIIPRGKHARFDDQVHRQPKGSPFQFAPEVFEPDASEGIRQSPRGDRLTLPTLGPSGTQERLNCWEKKRR